LIGPEQRGYAMFGGIMYQRGDTRSYFHIILLPYGEYGCQGTEQRFCWHSSSQSMLGLYRT
jgi:hypothetical protein